MTCVGPAQKLLAREIGDAGGGDELDAGTCTLDQGGVRPAQQSGWIVGERCGRREGCPDEGCTPRRLQTVADDVADDQHGGIHRPLGHQEEVAADLFGNGGQEGRGERQPRPLGQLGRRQRVSDRAQIVQLVLGDVEALLQHGEIPVAYLDFSAQARDQRLLALVQLIQIVDVTPLGRHLGAQPLKLSVVVSPGKVFAHDGRGTLVPSVSRAGHIVSHRPADCPCDGASTSAIAASMQQAGTDRALLVCSAAVLALWTAGSRGPGTGAGSGWAWGIDLGEAADLAGDGEEVVSGVERLGCGVEFVEHGADECGLAHVLGDADPLCVGGARDRGVGAVSEADRGRV
jgi:hypothetical protein